MDGFWIGYIAGLIYMILLGYFINHKFPEWECEEKHKIYSCVDAGYVPEVTNDTD